MVFKERPSLTNHFSKLTFFPQLIISHPKLLLNFLFLFLSDQKRLLIFNFSSFALVNSFFSIFSSPFIARAFSFCLKLDL
ncbi:unnamed protein product [Meloidogyne enterolobii]|uniref:Uncharacterized protein n=1 Tax=Meloidogyne enterolobii TaxID=390850 RepID=A0ACB1AYU6_MELEN